MSGPLLETPAGLWSSVALSLVLMMESVEQTITRVSQELGCSSTSRCVAEHLDRHDELRLLRQEFLIPKISDLPPCEWRFMTRHISQPDIWLRLYQHDGVFAQIHTSSDFSWFLLFLADLSLVDGSEDCVYLAGNSLGLQPKNTKKYIDEELEKWAKMWVVCLDLSADKCWISFRKT